MPATNWIVLGLVAAAALAFTSAEAAKHHLLAHHAALRAAPRLEVAITFDDLPVHSNMPPGVTRIQIAKAIIHALKADHAPPIYGFVNAHWLADQPRTAEVLKLWRAAGYPLGNHSWSHMDPNTNTVEAFEDDVLKDEPTLNEYMGRADWHWFREPFLHQGDTPEKRKAIGDFLAARRYRIAQVTLSWDDWAYNDVYARCLAKGDKDAVDWMKDAWLDGASVALLASQQMSQTLYGRNIPLVQLTHIGAFDAVMLPKLLDMYRKRGVKLIALPAAERDPAYADLNQHFPGGTMLDGQFMLRGIPIPPIASDHQTMLKLDALCR
jgi:peptidoglycan-N-acetylglucosamine deacetylase